MSWSKCCGCAMAFWCCRKVKQMAYATYIRPIVKYASPVWDPDTKRNTNKIEMVQHRCARYVTGNFDQTSSVTYNNNNNGYF